MSLENRFVGSNSRFSFVIWKIGMSFTRHPGWRAWLFSILAWAFILAHLFVPSSDINHLSNTVYCMPTGTMNANYPLNEINGTLHGASVLLKLLPIVISGLVTWVIMIVAMMFPLLNEPIRHVAFSVRQKNRRAATLGFFIGYTMTWTAMGILFVLLQFLSNRLIGQSNHFVTGLIKASGFLFTAVLVWHPLRLIKMIKCSQTMPIRIEGWQLFLDSLSYGHKIGVSCLSMCWAPMAALMLAHHNILVMYEVTVVLICERYLLPHTSKAPGYAWIVIAVTLFGFEFWA